MFIDIFALPFLPICLIPFLKTYQFILFPNFVPAFQCLPLKDHVLVYVTSVNLKTAFQHKHPTTGFLVISALLA